MIPIISADAISDEITALHKASSPQVDTELIQRVAEMGTSIRMQGDDALIAFTHQFESTEIAVETLRVSPSEVTQAHSQVSADFVAAIKQAIENVKWFHQQQVPANWDGTSPAGVKMGFRYTPIASVGLYVPGGRAIYPSSVVMNAVPAVLAGVKRVAMVSPARPDGTLAPEVIVAADLCGISEIYKIGGAQAVFALAYGTPSVLKVDKIVGPGNKYVTLAKQQVLGTVAIDKPAGPSEVVVYLESEDEARFAAADMLAQLEHDPDAVAVAISSSRPALDAVNRQFSILLADCHRKEIIEKSRRNARLFHVKSIGDAIGALNQLASEHVVIMGANPATTCAQVQNGGAFFLGPYSPVTVGDYIAGTNHVLPTAGAARFSSPLGVHDFLKSSSVVQYSKDQLAAVRAPIATLTQVEGLDAHQLNVEVRFEAL